LIKYHKTFKENLQLSHQSYISRSLPVTNNSDLWNSII